MEKLRKKIQKDQTYVVEDEICLVWLEHQSDRPVLSEPGVRPSVVDGLVVKSEDGLNVRPRVDSRSDGETSL